MPIEGVDYSWGRPRPSELAELGKRFAVRYVSYATTGKNLTRGEADALRAAGLSIVTNWENQAGDQLGGISRGRTHAAEADRLHRQCGGPPDRPIYFSTDFDATADQLKVCYDYLRGCADIIGWDRVGVYGGRRTIDYMLGRGVQWRWQTYAWSGLNNRFNPDDPRWVDGTHIHQYNNGVRLDNADTDLDRAMTADYGQWGQEDDVELTDTISLVDSNGDRTNAGRILARDEITVAQALAWAASVQRYVDTEVAGPLAAMAGQLAGLTVLVQQLAAAPPVNLTPQELADLTTAVMQAARAGAVDALERARIDVVD